jgi:neutral ceramidase
MQEWFAGLGEFDITPPPPIGMSGYAGRLGPADHVLDRLQVGALALGTGPSDAVVLTGADLLGISHGMVDRIRSRVADVLPPERLLLNHSHTHAGPAAQALRCMGAPDPAYCELVERWTAAAVREALRTMRPARLAFGAAETGIGMNRRARRGDRTLIADNPEGAYDPVVYVLRVDDASGAPLAAWFSHATHPVTLGRENTGISADWPGAARAALTAVLGCPAVFAQGCTGDVNPVRRGDYGITRSLGRELAGSALVAWERATPLEGKGTAAALESLRLPAQKPSVTEAEGALEQARARFEATEAEIAAAAGLSPNDQRLKRETPHGMLEWAADYLAAARAAGEPHLRMDVQALRVGDLTLVGTGQPIMALARTGIAAALGYTNGCYGYLPTEKAFPLGGYEVDGAHRYYGTLMVTAAAERLTLEAVQRLVATLESDLASR